MKATILTEPELEFGYGRHIDTRFGLLNYGPLDYDRPTAPRNIRVGIVGTNETVEGVATWLERCREPILPKISRQPNLFPGFPGCTSDSGLYTELILDSRLQRTIPQRRFDGLKRHRDLRAIISEATELFLEELRYLTAETQVDVLICAVPLVQLEATEGYDRLAGETTKADPEEAGLANDTEGEVEANGADSGRLDFHDLIKAQAMALGKPIQLILPATYDATKRRRQKIHSERLRQTQDEATRAWNLHTALYYKAGGTPWRIVRDPAAFTTCFVGVSFYRSLDGDELHTSVAQVFDERGDGIVVRGGTAQVAKEDRKPHLDSNGAQKLLSDALARYRAEHRTLPARIVIHKSSSFNDAELSGFMSAADEQRIELVDLLSLSNSFSRLFRDGAYPPLRGTFLSLDSLTHVLYTRGSVDFFRTYPGMYIPRPLLMRLDHTDSTPTYLAREIMALTKMNWNNTQFDGDEPITLAAARKVSKILRYTNSQQPIAPRYSFYM